MRGGSVSVERVFVQVRAVGADGVPAVGGTIRSEARADGVVEDVLDGGGEVVVAGDDAAREAVAPEVARAGVLDVEALGVDAVESAEAVGELLARAGEDEVDVVRHEAERDHVPALRGRDISEEGQEDAVVRVVSEDGAAVNAAGGDVVDAVGEGSPRDPGHGSTVRPIGQADRALERFVTLLARSAWLVETRTRDSPWFGQRRRLGYPRPARSKLLRAEGP
jgi:hypothetical protein